MPMESFWMNLQAMTTEAENLLNVPITEGVTVAMLAAVMLFILLIAKLSEGED